MGHQGGEMWRCDRKTGRFFDDAVAGQSEREAVMAVLGFA